jgi:hypothetical protein
MSKPEGKMVFIFKNTTKPNQPKKFIRRDIMSFFSFRKQAQEWAQTEAKIRMEEDQGRTPEDSEFQLSIQTIEMLLAESQKNCFITVFFNDLTGSQQSFILESNNDVLWMTPEEAEIVAKQIVNDDAELTVKITNIDEEV